MALTVGYVFLSLGKMHVNFIIFSAVKIYENSQQEILSIVRLVLEFFCSLLLVVCLGQFSQAWAWTSPHGSNLDLA